MTVIVIVFVLTVIIREPTIRMLNTDTNTDSNGSRRNSTSTSTLPAGGVMQNLGLWGGCFASTTKAARNSVFGSEII